MMFCLNMKKRNVTCQSELYDTLDDKNFKNWTTSCSLSDYDYYYWVEIEKESRCPRLSCERKLICGNEIDGSGLGKRDRRLKRSVMPFYVLEVYVA